MTEAEAPLETVERVATLLDIFILINALLQKPDRADEWMRKPNKAPGFTSRSAIEVIESLGLEGIEVVRAHLSSSF